MVPCALVWKWYCCVSKYRLRRATCLSFHCSLTSGGARSWCNDCTHPWCNLFCILQLVVYGFRFLIFLHDLIVKMCLIVPHLFWFLQMCFHLIQVFNSEDCQRPPVLDSGGPYPLESFIDSVPTEPYQTSFRRTVRLQIFHPYSSMLWTPPHNKAQRWLLSRSPHLCAGLPCPLARTQPFRITT